MSIASRIDAIEEHLTQDYVMLEKLGFYNNENKNIQNISPILENFYNKVGNKTKIVKEGIVGETSQETTNGYQLINQPTTETSSTHNGLTYKSLPDGTLSIKGTATANQQYFLNCSTGAFQETSAYISLPAGTYTAKYIVISGTMTFNIILRTGMTNIVSAMQEGANTFTLSENINNFNIYFYTSNGISRDVEFKMILEKGSTSHDWEKYTGGNPAPNPDYPMPVNTRTGELSYKVQGKNYLETQYLPKASTSINDNYSVKNAYLPQGTYTLATTDNSTFGSNLFIKLFDKSTGQVISETGHLTINNSSTSFSSSTYNYYASGLDILTSIQFTIDNDYYARIGLQTSDNTKEVMLVKGTDVVRKFEPYISRTFPINLGKNLFDKNNTNKISSYINDEGVIKDANRARSIYISCKPNTTYTVSKIASTRFRIASSKNYTHNTVTTNFASDLTGTTLTIKTGVNDTYLIVFYYFASTDTLTEQEILDSIQIEEGSQATSYSAYKTPIELCKIGTYQDYISKENGVWYKKSYINKKILNGSEDWSLQSINSYNIANFSYNGLTDYMGSNNQSFVNYFSPQTTGIANTTTEGYLLNNLKFLYIRIKDTTASTVQQFQTWLSTHNTDVYYVLATPTTTVITDEELISQLDAIEDFLTQYKINDEFILGYDEPSVEY